MGEHDIVGGMKEARILLPHRSNSVIQDWIVKGICAVVNPEAPKTGHPYQFTALQLLDLMVVDQLSALGVFAKPYKGRNFLNAERDDPNVLELFHYGRKAANRDLGPEYRSRRHAISFYSRFDCKVLVSIFLLRVLPPLDSWLKEVHLSKKQREREKIGMLYYRINYWPESQHTVATEVEAWRKGYPDGRGHALCLISVDQLRKDIELTLHITI